MSTLGREALSQLSKVGQSSVDCVPSVRRVCSQFLLFILVRADMDFVGSEGIILPLMFSRGTRVSCNNELNVSEETTPLRHC